MKDIRSNVAYNIVFPSDIHIKTLKTEFIVDAT
jgi:hypothetical protein